MPNILIFLLHYMILDYHINILYLSSIYDERNFMRSIYAKGRTRTSVARKIVQLAINLVISLNCKCDFVISFFYSIFRGFMRAFLSSSANLTFSPGFDAYRNTANDVT